MKPDPTIDAIRKVRHQISASVHHDPWQLVEHYRQLQEKHQDRVVSRNIGTTKAPGNSSAEYNGSDPLPQGMSLPGA